jgi:hypothetical protein
MSDNEDDSDSESDNYYGFDWDEFAVRHGGELSDDDSADHNHDTPASSVPQLCAQLRSNDPSVLSEGPNEVFQPDVPDSCRQEIAEALLQNTIVRNIRLDLKHYSTSSADALTKYLAQSKCLLSVELTLSLRNGMQRPQQQFLPTFFEAIGQSNSIKELNLTCPDLGPTSDSNEKSPTFTSRLARTRA